VKNGGMKQIGAVFDFVEKGSVHTYVMGVKRKQKGKAQPKVQYRNHPKIGKENERGGMVRYDTSS